MILAVVLWAVLLALVLAIGLVLPAIADPTVPFGVRIPAGRVGDGAVTRQIRAHRRRLLGSGLVATAAEALAAGVEPRRQSRGALNRYTFVSRSSKPSR